MHSALFRSGGFITLVIAIALLTGSIAFAESGDTVTIEEHYLSSETTMGSIEAQLSSDSLDLQMTALLALQDQVQRGVMDPDSDEYILALSKVSSRGITNLSRQPYNLPNGYRPEMRRFAAELLRHSRNNPRAVNVLSILLENDPEPMVRARAALSLAEIGKDPDQAVSLRLGTALRQEALTGRDESFIYSSLIAIQRLGNEVGMQGLHLEARDSAIHVATGGFNRLLTEKATQVLAQM